MSSTEQQQAEQLYRQHAPKLDPVTTKSLRSRLRSRPARTSVDAQLSSYVQTATTAVYEREEPAAVAPQQQDKWATRFEYVGLASWLAENIVEPPVVTEATSARKIAEAILKAGVRDPKTKTTRGGVPILFPRLHSRFGDGTIEWESWDKLVRDDAIWEDGDEDEETSNGGGLC
jgi:hypothetical protein